jgi:hypothetical protein
MSEISRQEIVNTINRLAQAGNVDDAALLAEAYKVSDEELNEALA